MLYKCSLLTARFFASNATVCHIQQIDGLIHVKSNHALVNFRIEFFSFSNTQLTLFCAAHSLQLQACLAGFSIMCRHFPKEFDDLHNSIAYQTGSCKKFGSTLLPHLIDTHPKTGLGIITEYSSSQTIVLT